MPPKKAVKNLEGATDGASDGTTGGITMSASDLEFIQQCCMNTMGGEITVDCTAVASARGQANARSIANRITIIKKKYGLPFTAGNTNGDKSKAKANVDDDDEAVSSSVKTPSKKATPKRASAGTKRKVAATQPKARKKVKAEEVPLPEEDSEASDEVEDREGNQEKDYQVTPVFAAVNVPRKDAPAEETSEEMLYDKYDEYSNEN